VIPFHQYCAVISYCNIFLPKFEFICCRSTARLTQTIRGRNLASNMKLSGSQEIYCNDLGKARRISLDIFWQTTRVLFSCFDAADPPESEVPGREEGLPLLLDSVSVMTFLNASNVPVNLDAPSLKSGTCRCLITFDIS
jgi:hypothetical protein